MRTRGGVSSNGRTAVSGTVCEGSTPSTPANVAPSSSGLGRRPLKAEIAGSNPVGATSYLFGQDHFGPDFFYWVAGHCFQLSFCMPLSHRRYFFLRFFLPFLPQEQS